MEQLHSSRWSDTAACLTHLRCFPVKLEIPMCSAALAIDFDHFDILASDANKFRRLIKESLLIKRDQPQLNKTIKSFPLKPFD